MFSIGRFYFYLLLVAMVSGQGKQTLEWGGVLALKLNTTPPPDSSILWKHYANKVVEYDRDFSDQGITDYGTFKGRATLDKTTGKLTVTSLTNADDGPYSVEYNSKLQPDTFTINVLRAVSKPTIQIPHSCNHDSCTLTCEGSTTDAGDVSYSWKKGDGQMTVSQKTLQITSEDPSPITCQLANQLSARESDSVPNPLHPRVGLIVGIVVLILGIGGILGIVVWKVPFLKESVSNLFQRLRNATHNVTGANAGQDGATTDTNNRNPEKVPLSKAKTPDLHENTEDRPDNGPGSDSTGIPDIPPESAPLIDRPHKDDSNNEGVDPDLIISPNVPQNPSDRKESSQSYAPKEDRPATDPETGPLKKSDDGDKGDGESEKL